MLTQSSFWRSLFRLIHIYAGIFIAPFILFAAITGLLYAITPQFEQAIYKDVLYVESLNQTPHKLSQQIEAAKQVMPKSAQVIEVRPAPSSNQTTRVIFSDPIHDFTSEAVFIDPFTLKAQGHLAVYGTSGVLPFRTTLDQLHINLLLGKWGRFYSELAASWLAILTLTGLYNWLKRRQNLKIRQTKKNRLLRWHSTLGLTLFPLLLIIAVTGLTWSEWAGDNIRVARQWLNWQTPILATSLQTDNLPTVMHHQHHEMPHSENLNLNIVSTEYDTALSIARAHGIDAAQIQIKPPTSGNQAWTVAEIQRKWPTQADSIAIDMEQHKVIDQLAFKDYSLVAKLTRWGVDAHIGVLFGWINQLVLALYAFALCIMIIYGYRAAFKNSNLKLMTTHFVGQSLSVWNRATRSQKIWLILVGIVLGLSLPVFGFSILFTLFIFAMRKYIPSKS